MRDPGGPALGNAPRDRLFQGANDGGMVVLGQEAHQLHLAKACPLHGRHLVFQGQWGIEMYEGVLGETRKNRLRVGIRVFGKG